MKREEYERLLNSEYWKGYSYSLIKERDFRCENCGRQFLNERNKLQVHHRVYRDANPWSYKPEELMVLCKECHELKHGIYSPNSGYSESYRNHQMEVGNISSVKDSLSKLDEYKTDSRYFIDNNFSSVPRPLKRKSIGIVITCILLGLLAYNISTRNAVSPDSTKVTDIDSKIIPSKKAIMDINNDANTSHIHKPTTNDKFIKDVKNTKVSSGSTTSDILEASTYADVVKEAKRAGVSTEGLTSDILERMTHASVVKEAKRAGVSTEGSTSDILERMTHASVVKEAKSAGVSTEGSTSDILERMTHASVVKEAKSAGVSTEGSTSDILERMTHASVVKEAKSAGVSTEGSTSDILERITRKNLENYSK